MATLERLAQQSERTTQADGRILKVLTIQGELS
jgi:hypothetical protein